jgi:LysM repeat protein
MVTIKGTGPMTRPSERPTPGERYTVVKGDNFWKIAEAAGANGASWVKIYSANRGKVVNPNRIRPGMVLVIPAGLKLRKEPSVSVERLARAAATEAAELDKGLAVRAAFVTFINEKANTQPALAERDLETLKAIDERLISMEAQAQLSDEGASLAGAIDEKAHTANGQKVGNGDGRLTARELTVFERDNAKRPEPLALDPQFSFLRQKLVK